MQMTFSRIAGTQPSAETIARIYAERVPPEELADARSCQSPEQLDCWMGMWLPGEPECRTAMTAALADVIEADADRLAEELFRADRRRWQAFGLQADTLWEKAVERFRASIDWGDVLRALQVEENALAAA